jgi:hypothetical protein
LGFNTWFLGRPEIVDLWVLAAPAASKTSPKGGGCTSSAPRPPSGHSFFTIARTPHSKPYKFIGFGATDAPKPYEFIRFGVIHGPKPYKFIGFWASFDRNHLRRCYSHRGLIGAGPCRVTVSRGLVRILLRAQRTQRSLHHIRLDSSRRHVKAVECFRIAGKDSALH